MPDHISNTALAIGLIVTFGVRFMLLVGFLRMMIHFQKMNFTWLPLLGAAFLAAGLDMVPLVGHYLAVPVLYLCVWKITNCELVPDAVFTVALSYGLTFMMTLIFLAYAPVPKFHPASAQDYNFDDLTNAPAVAVVQPTNQVADTAVTPAPANPSAPDPATPPDNNNNKIASDISIKGVSGVGNNALVTIQYRKKNYIISPGEGVTISTDAGLASVRFLETDGDVVKLAVNGQPVKYPVN
jgi:hypothetical protein